MSFASDMNKHLGRYEKRIMAVTRASIQDVVNRAQEPTAKGGRMRVDTGFLRASGGAALNQMPSGPTSADDAVSGGSQTGQPLAVALARMKPGDSLYWGWSANYARPREFKDGFARGAAEKWPEIVDSVANQAKARGL